ncbi:MAG: restriction endonuclease subunit S, partial [Prevotellaceae bacterium]|nr:restriction endonuclease subunit S [Prevotellaceae bacterium]
IEIDFDKETINYGNKIQSDSKTTQNFSQPENFVVLECVDRLLEKGYQPQNLILEKTYPAGHGTSGRLDICVTRNDGSEYLLIECKTYGKEFDKAFARMKKDGGQLFTYFKFSNKPDLIMLYASELKDKEIVFRNEIIKIEDNYRTGDVKDFYEKWNKLTKDNGVFDKWVKPYNFESKALTANDLKDIKPEDSSFIFNRFLEILRHNVVSDKPNSFNKIFTLFLCKIYDEKANEGTNKELGFQWIEGVDNDISFQLRLTDLYKKGMYEFLEKKVTDFSEDEFDKKYQQLFLSNDALSKELKRDINRIRLEKNNEFAIKEVYDEKSFYENAKVVKEVVELLQRYKIRYAKKQQYLSDFFELLLTTGLKQESGQFFTPVPIAQFIIKSLPVDSFVRKKLHEGKRDELLPYIIDYAAGSGHFITESMHELQNLLENIDSSEFFGDAKKIVDKAKTYPYDWALQYIYGVEKDYRLVKVGKVGCYLHGDGLANVIHCDGLASFNYPEYKNKLSHKDDNFPKENKQFDILISNPPYSVSAFKNVAREYYTEKDFDLYESISDVSSEIECLFVERTKQLLKDGGVAGVILPSSILSNDGIYAQAREIILQYFEIIAITALGSNTFMATGTNTVILFLRRKNNYDVINLQKYVERFFNDFQDVTRNGIDKPVAKYVNHVWENISLDDYVTMLKKSPNEKIKQHEIYREYKKNINTKTEKDFWNALIEIEKEKLFYFILAYPQKNVVLIKTGDKDDEKRFLGYEFSNRRGSEGIHPVQRGKSIAECTRLFDEDNFDNPEKSSFYIYKAFLGEYPTIHETLKDNISYFNLIDMLTFDRKIFDKNISLTVKDKAKVESKWELVQLGNVLYENTKSKIKVGTAKDSQVGNYPFFTSGESVLKFNEYLVDGENVFLSTGGNAVVKFYSGKAAYSTDTFVVKSNNEESLKTKFIFYYLESIISIINELYFKGVGLKHLQKPDFRNIKIPFPPKEIQEKIVAEIEAVENKEAEAKEKIDRLKNEINLIINLLFDNRNEYNKVEIQNIAKVLGGKRIPKELSLAANKTDYPYIRVSDLKNGTIDLGSLKYIDENVFNRIKNYTISKTDVYISIAGTIGLVGLVPDELDGKSLTENAAKIVIDTTKTTKEFLYYCLSSNNLQKQIKDNTRSVGVPKLALKRIETLKIPLPPLSEQRKIVSEIENIENQISEAQKIIENSADIKNGIMKKYL